METAATFTGNTKIIGRVGCKPSTSGNTIYNPLLQHMGVDMLYLQFVLEEGKSKEYLESVKNLGVLGSAVTGSHTHDLMDLVDEVAESAEVTHHGNCLVNAGGRTTMHSTDVAGMMRTLQPLVGELKDKVIVIVGGGALIPGILTELHKHTPANVTLYNRTVSKVEKLAKDYNVEVGGGLDELVQHAKGDIFINASDIGAGWCEQNDDIYTDELLKRFAYAQDVTFKPSISTWAARADRLGLKVGWGYEMFAEQGAEQLRLIAGLEVDMNYMTPLVKAGLDG